MYLSKSISENQLLLSIGGFSLVIYLTKKYMAGGVCKSHAKLHGKTVIITGSNTGIGKETAKDLAQRGAKVILACRNIERANKAAEDIRQFTDQGSIRVMKLDLASFASVREFTKEFLDTEDHLDILINNAGLGLFGEQEKTLTEDGNELTLQSNHLGHFLLTNLLMDKMEEFPGSRIINVSSIAHAGPRWDMPKNRYLDINDLNFDSNEYDGFTAYGCSKLANILFTKELAKRLKNTTTSALHPGVIETEIWRHFGIGIKIFQLFLWPVRKIFMKNCWEGAQTTIFCAVDESLDEVSGKYYADCQEAKFLNPQAEDEDLAKKLWEKSAELVQL